MPDILSSTNGRLTSVQPGSVVAGADDKLQGTYSPTVLTDANIRENVIPETLNKANTLLGPSTPIVGGKSDTNTGNSDTTGASPDYASYYKDALGLLDSSNPETQNELSSLSSMQERGDQNFNDLTDIIHSQYANRRTQLEQNQSQAEKSLQHTLSAAGVNRYSPIQSKQIMTDVENEKVKSLSNIDVQERQAEVQARQARDDQDYKLLGDKLNILSDLRTKKIALATDLGKTMLTENQKQADTATANLEAAKKDAADTALKNGAPKSVIDSINAATHPIDAYSAASGYGGNANRDIVQLDNGDGTKSTVLIDKNDGHIVKWIGGGDGNGSSGGSTVQGGTPAATTLNAADKDFLTGRTPEQATAYNNLSTLDKSNVRQLISGDVLLSDLISSRGVAGSAQKQKLLQEAQSVDPTFSENTNKIRYSFMKDWTDANGKSFNNRNTINTALGHIAELKDAVSSLDNSTLNKYNSFTNFIGKETGNPAVPDFDTIIQALATEYAGLYKNGTPSDDEINGWKGKFESNYSPRTLNSLVNLVTGLASDRINAVTNEYKGVMGKYPTDSIVQNDSLQRLKDSGVDISKLQTVVNKSTGNNTEIAPGESTAKEEIVSYGQANPAERGTIRSLVTDNDKTLGRPLTYAEALQYLQSVGKIKK